MSCVKVIAFRLYTLWRCVMLTWHQNSFHGQVLNSGKREKKVVQNVHTFCSQVLGAEISKPIYIEFFLLKLPSPTPYHCEIYICLPNYFRHIPQIKSQPVAGVSLSAFHLFVFVYDVFCLLHFCDTFVQSYLAFRSSSY